MKKYQLRLHIVVTDLETGREAEPPWTNYEGGTAKLEKHMLAELQECIKDLNDPEWIKEYDEI